jgi:hypothetical protein
MLNENVKKCRILTFQKGNSIGFRSRIIDWGQKKSRAKMARLIFWVEQDQSTLMGRMR